LKSILNRGSEDWCMSIESQAKEKYKFDLPPKKWTL
jgi:hypothetical protein